MWKKNEEKNKKTTRKRLARRGHAKPDKAALGLEAEKGEHFIET